METAPAQGHRLVRLHSTAAVREQWAGPRPAPRPTKQVKSTETLGARAHIIKPAGSPSVSPPCPHWQTPPRPLALLRRPFRPQTSDPTSASRPWIWETRGSKPVQGVTILICTNRRAVHRAAWIPPLDKRPTGASGKTRIGVERSCFSRPSRPCDHVLHTTDPLGPASPPSSIPPFTQVMIWSR